VLCLLWVDAIFAELAFFGYGWIGQMLGGLYIHKFSLLRHKVGPWVMSYYLRMVRHLRAKTVSRYLR
jgi:hypothetical protein